MKIQEETFLLMENICKNSPSFCTKGISNLEDGEHCHTFCRRQHTWRSRASYPRATGEAWPPTQQEERAVKLKTTEDIILSPGKRYGDFLLCGISNMCHSWHAFLSPTFNEHLLCPSTWGYKKKTKPLPTGFVFSLSTERDYHKVTRKGHQRFACKGDKVLNVGGSRPQSLRSECLSIQLS